MSTTREHYRIEDIKNFQIKVLTSGGYNPKAAEATSYALLYADMRGIFSHGVAGGTGIEEAVSRSGITATVDPTAEPIILEQKYPSIIVVDGNGAPGHHAAAVAVDQVKKLARKYGIAKAFVNNTNHYGAAGAWSEEIASDGDLKGEVYCTTAAMARVMGDDPQKLDYTKGAGKEIRLGTNPIALSYPHEKGILTLDMAYTRMAVSLCLKKLKAGEMLTTPEYVADKDFKSTLDPTDFVESMAKLDQIQGTVFPFGSTLSGYKGDSLLRFVEIDQVFGGGPTNKIPVGPSKERRISHSFQAQAIDFHFSKEDAKAQLGKLMTDYESKYFGSASRWPGDRSLQAKEYSKKEGVPYSKGQVDTLRRSAEHVGLNFEDLLKPISTKEYPEDIFNK
ncbi:MAG: Ldh family oxidoreductase [Candidatus Heimdallarchaeota archaeon]|nr:Ldh family oxidoreductase [Candidatus Heimdallarchaeota archaeon]